MLRHSLLAEHLGLRAESVPELLEHHGSMAAMIDAAGDAAHRHLMPFHPKVDDGILGDLAARQTFDPEEPEDLFEIRAPRHGLFRDGSLLAKARARLSRKSSKQDE